MTGELKHEEIGIKLLYGNNADESILPLPAPAGNRGADAGGRIGTSAIRVD